MEVTTLILIDFAIFNLNSFNTFRKAVDWMDKGLQSKECAEFIASMVSSERGICPCKIPFSKYMTQVPAMTTMSGSGLFKA